MSHNRKLGKPTDQRIAMLRAMTTYLLENGQIKTTVSRAKEVAPMAEKMITLAKNANLANYRKALSYLTKEDVAKKLFDEIGPKYATRNGGYTRVVKIGPPPRRLRRDGHRPAGVITRKRASKARPAAGWARFFAYGRRDRKSQPSPCILQEAVLYYTLINQKETVSPRGRTSA